MKYKRTPTISIVTLLLLSSCARHIDSFIRTPTPTLIQTPTPTLSPILQTEENVLSSACQVTVEQTFPDFKGGGMIVLSGYIGYSGESFSDLSYLYNMETRNLIPIPQEPERYILSFSFMVSPDRSHLAYVQENDNYTNMDLSRDPYLRIVTSTGVEEEKYKIQISSAFKWLDENHIILEQRVSGDSNSFPPPSGSTVETAPSSFSWFLLNTTTGEMQELRSKFPGQTLFGQIISFNASRLIYNSTLDRVIYPAALPNTVIRLYDVKTDQVIADVPTTDFGKFHTWSPDGKKIVFATNVRRDGKIGDEILMLDDNGVLSQLSYLSPSELHSEITGLSWSPDGGQIAYWANRYGTQMEFNSSHLVVQNATTKEEREYCDIVIPNGDYYSNWEDPIWSPDGKFLLSTMTMYDNPQESIVLVLEISTGKAYQIATDFRAVGWLR